MLELHPVVQKILKCWEINIKGSYINEITAIEEGFQGFFDDSTKALELRGVTMEEGVSEIVQNCPKLRDIIYGRTLSPNTMANKRRQKMNNEIIRYDTKQAKKRRIMKLSISNLSSFFHLFAYLKGFLY